MSSDGTENAVKSDFEAGVEFASDVPVIYMDSQELEMTPADYQLYEDTSDPEVEERLEAMMERDGETLQASFEEQIPGITDDMSFFELEELAQASVTHGPAAMRMVNEGSEFCIVNKPTELLDEKNEIAAAMSGEDISNLQEVPGTDAVWNRAVGVHEGTHCIQEFNTAAMSADEVIVNTLTREAVADKATMDDMKNHGEHEAAQAFKDYRALDTSDNVKHATSALVDDEGGIEATQTHVNMAMILDDLLIKVVAEDQGISKDEAETLREEDPKKFIDTADRLIQEADAKGELSGHPELKEYAEDYIGAVQRQLVGEVVPAVEVPNVKAVEPAVEVVPAVEVPNVKAVEPAVEVVPAEDMPDSVSVDLGDIDGGTPRMVHGDIGSNMEIGDVSASAFFASHADPAMAEQRLELAATQEASITNAPVIDNSAEIVVQAPPQMEL